MIWLILSVLVGAGLVVGDYMAAMRDPNRRARLNALAYLGTLITIYSIFGIRLLL